MPRGAQGEGSLYQRKTDGRWCATVFLGYDPGSGKRVRKAFYAQTQREAVDKRRRFMRQVENGERSATSSPRSAYTLGAWLDYWLEHMVGPEREPTTYEGYESVVRLHIKPHLGRMPLGSLQTEHVDHWLADLKARGVGTRTRQVALSRLRTALNVALARKQQTGLRFNPAARELVMMPRGQAKRVQAPEVDHARRLLDAASGHRLEAIVIVALTVALRKGEILGLHWEDIDLDAATLTVRRHVNRARGELVVRPGSKMHPEDELPVPLPSMTVRALRAHRSRQVAERLHAGARWKGAEPTKGGHPSGIVFTSTVGTVLEPRNVTRAFADIRRKAGLPSKTIHQLRHDCASLLLAEGVPMYVVSKILRHASPQITARFYAHIVPEVHREAAQMMDGILGPG